MKIQAYYLLIAFLLTALVTSCDNKGYPQQLIVADSLADISPQQSLKILDKWQQSSPNASKRYRMFADLVRFKAEDKAYMAHKPADTVSIKNIVNYYKLHDNHLLTEAYFYAGSLYRDLYDYPTALKYFQLARTTLPTNAKAELKYKIYAQIGDIFKAQDMTKESKDMDLLALNYAKQIKDTLKIITLQINIAHKYQQIGKIDSCNYYLNQAFKNTDNKQKLKDFVLEQKAIILLSRGQKKQALNIITHISNIGLKDYEKNVRYAVMRDIFHAVGMEDSAIFYCKQLLEYGDVTAKRNSYYMLYEIYEKRNKKNLANNYLQKYKIYEDTVKKTDYIQEVAKQNAAFNYNSVVKEKTKLKTSIVIIISFYILLLIVGVAIFYRHIIYRSRIKKKVEKLNRQLTDALIEHKRQLAAVMNDSTIQKSLEKSVTTKDSEEKEKIKTIAKNNLTKILSEHLIEEKKISRTQWDYIYELFNCLYPDFYDKVHSMAKIDSHGYNICLLTKLQFTAKDIAILTIHTTNAISLAKKRLYKKLTGKDGVPKDLDKLMTEI